MDLISENAWLEYQRREKKPLKLSGLENVKKGEMYELLEEIAVHFILADPKAMWDSGDGGWIPVDNTLTEWVNTDGTRKRMSLLGLMMFYTWNIDWLMDSLHNRDIEVIVRKHIRAAVKNQETYEGRKLAAN